MPYYIITKETGNRKERRKKKIEVNLDSWKNVIVHIQAKVPNKVKLELPKKKKKPRSSVNR